VNWARKSFTSKARDGDVAAGTLLVKINERRSSLLGLNSPRGVSVNVMTVLYHSVKG
jgi:hypothetical protein